MSKLIAPHEGRELELVIAGIKPLALIEDSKQPIIANMLRGELPRMLFPELHIVKREKEVLITKKGNEFNIALYEGLLHLHRSRRSDKDYTIAMGKLFGYTEEEIKAFLEGDLKCNCEKCVGISRYHGDKQ